MAARSLVQHKPRNLKSLGAFYKALPEFSEIQTGTKSYVDKAFNASIIEGQTNLKYWKDFRTELLAKKPTLTPREFARLKFALTHSTQELEETYLGRPVLHDWIDQQTEKMLPFMTSIELVSTLSSFGKLSSPEFYEKTVNLLITEMKQEEDLDVISIAPYVVSNSYRDPLPPHPVRIDPKQQEIAVKFLQEMTPKILDRLTEFSDDQLSSICGGIAGSQASVKLRAKIHLLADSIEQEILIRRLNRFNITNLVDVVKGFANVNLGSEKLFENLRGKILEKGQDLDFDTAIDLGSSLSLREPISKELQKIINSKLSIKTDMKKKYLQKLSIYLFNTQSKDETLLRSYVDYIENLKYVNILDYQHVRKMKYHIEKVNIKLINEDYGEKLEEKGYLFIGQRLCEHNPEVESKYFDKMRNWINCHLKYKCAHNYLFENHETMQFGFMPQKVALMTAFPDFSLRGKYVYDDRLVKDPKYKYQTTHEFEMKCRWLELLGFKVAKLNYHDLVENMETWQDRDQLLIGCLSNMGIPPPEPK